ncbi:MAG: fatty acid desaturase [Bacteroidetes bacterium]|nr:fatty acid desaturase [Bacteroidota bacterium]
MKISSVFSGPARIKLSYQFAGSVTALLVILIWLGSLVFGLIRPVSWNDPWIYIHVLIQTHLYTGLFITAHDAMHHLISPNRNTNHGYGILAATLFMLNNYAGLYAKHHQHHLYVGTEKDPDYHPGNVWIWYFKFLKEYVSIWQIIGVGILFNLMALFFDQTNLFLFWIIPAVLSTFQLFFFGTYLPHRGDFAESNIHKARSFPKKHVLAFLSCYFFGYHYEHHDKPFIPWWMLWREREKSQVS